MFNLKKATYKIKSDSTFENKKNNTKTFPKGIQRNNIQTKLEREYSKKQMSEIFSLLR